MPICSGRSILPFSKQVLSDNFVSISTSSETFKCKGGNNVNEDNLFKNEDDMYTVDSSILVHNIVNEHLKKEMELAEKWLAERDANCQLRYEPTWLTKGDLAFITNMYAETEIRNRVKMIEKLYNFPRKFLEIVQNRIQKRLDQHVEEKKRKVGEWRNCCEQNFYKSLDHRQFIFKEVQKKQYPNKKQIE